MTDKWKINAFLFNIVSRSWFCCHPAIHPDTKSISLNLFWKIVSRLFLDRPPRKATTVFQLEMLQKKNYFPDWNVARKTNRIFVWSKPFTFARGKVHSVEGWLTLLNFFYFSFKFTFATGKVRSIVKWWTLLNKISFTELQLIVTLSQLVLLLLIFVSIGCVS